MLLVFLGGLLLLGAVSAGRRLPSAVPSAFDLLAGICNQPFQMHLFPHSFAVARHFRQNTPQKPTSYFSRPVLPLPSRATSANGHF
jgi:hypothetical protein